MKKKPQTELASFSRTLFIKHTDNTRCRCRRRRRRSRRLIIYVVSIMILLQHTRTPCAIHDYGVCRARCVPALSYLIILLRTKINE